MVQEADMPFHFAMYLLTTKHCMRGAAAVIDEIRRSPAREGESARIDALVEMWLACHAAASAEWVRRVRMEPRSAPLMNDSRYRHVAAALAETVLYARPMEAAEREQAITECARRHVQSELEQIDFVLVSDGGNADAD